MVRDQTPTFIWTSQCEDVNFRLLQDHQVVNHFDGIRAFTTKVRAWSHQGCGAGDEQGWWWWVQH